ncbi:MAG TPA: L,D-transpeptidase family protein [Chthoniobacteraceae bacterium]|nr:L,D-transpeptidase family protein [Chthoniobacteraceae bacterium]
MPRFPRPVLVFSALLLLSLLGSWLVRFFEPSPPEQRETIASRLKALGPKAEARLRPAFEEAGVAWPPARVVLAAFKEEKRLELYAAQKGGALRHIRSYPILAASGRPGPKLREGDRQVPEGRYRIEYLNPNSRFHLSMKLDYPNAFDRRHAAAEGRTGLGGDIMIHGKAVSIGCLAMGDPAAEELFVLAARSGIENVEVIIAPVDFRVRALPEKLAATLPPWTRELYDDLRKALAEL